MSRESQQAFLAGVKALWPVAKGSLAEVRKPCARPRCARCARGEKHPAFIFTFLEQGRRRCMHVPRELAPVVRRAIENGRRLEEAIGRAGVEVILEYRRRRDAGAERGRAR